MTSKTPLLLATVLVSLSAAAFAAEGYKDTPIIPGTKWHVHDPDRPLPPVVKPGEPSTQDKAGTAPSDAVVLFDGKDLSKWKSGNAEAKWKVENGVAVSGGGDIQTKDEFGPDFQLHLEWAAPVPAKGSGQGRGNSGIFLFGRYEIQILDNYENPTYADGHATAIYDYLPPQVNVCRKPGEWQTYDIICEGPRFKEGKLEKPMVVTVLHNGVVTQNRSVLRGDTPFRSLGSYRPHAEKGPFRLQDHNNPVQFRNIWVRELRMPSKEDLGDGPVIGK